MRRIIFLFFIFCLMAQSRASLFAQEPSFEILQKSMVDMQKSMQQLQHMVMQQNELIQKQQTQINALENKPGVAISSVDPLAQRPNGAEQKHSWRPEIGVMGDFVGQWDSPNNEDSEGRDRFSARELELVLESAIDSYSRLDAAIAFSDFEEVALEEAYYTNKGLPLDVTGRFGKFKPHIGKALQVHRYTLDTVDEPLVIQRYFGVEGYSKAGIDFTRNISMPWAVSHQISAGFLEGGNGDGGALFNQNRRYPTLYAHLQNYLEMTSNSGVEFGASYLTGSSDSDVTFGTHVIGADLTWIWNYAEQRHFKIQGENFAGTRHENTGAEAIDPVTGAVSFPEVDDSRGFWGSYLLADWRFHPKWAVGTRLDHVSRIRTTELINHDQPDLGYAAYLTFYQNDFARWRIQLNQRNLTVGNNEYEAFVQGTFTINEHTHSDG